MNNIATLSDSERSALFKNTANQKGIHEAIVEKDFWVCFVLDYLFHRSEWKDRIVFKGGTSLSKAYGLIERFSEDIDLILDWRILGYEKDEPWKERSNTKQDKFNKEVKAKTEIFLTETFIPSVKKDLSKELKTEVEIYNRASDPQNVVFVYPRSFYSDAILPEIRLEIGPLAAWTPAESREISSYAAEIYPIVFQKPASDILTVLPTRTFWEKVTILHREAFRSEELEFPRRYSRHYYDLYYLAKHCVMDEALKDKMLLEKVVDFKDKFYHCAWANYADARRGYIRLMPPEYNINKLRDDYERTKSMIFGDRPAFEDILEGIEKIEEEIQKAFSD